MAEQGDGQPRRQRPLLVHTLLSHQAQSVLDLTLATDTVAQIDTLGVPCLVSQRPQGSPAYNNLGTQQIAAAVICGP